VPRAGAFCQLSYRRRRLQGELQRHQHIHIIPKSEHGLETLPLLRKAVAFCAAGAVNEL